MVSDIYILPLCRGEALVEGILPKGPYLPCLSCQKGPICHALRMADRALLAGYPPLPPCMGLWIAVPSSQWNVIITCPVTFIAAVKGTLWVPTWKWLPRNWAVGSLSIDPSHKSHNAPVPYPLMHHFVTEMCTFLLQNGALWDICLMLCRICEMALFSESC